MKRLIWRTNTAHARVWRAGTFARNGLKGKMAMLLMLPILAFAGACAPIQPGLVEITPGGDPQAAAAATVQPADTPSEADAVEAEATTDAPAPAVDQRSVTLVQNVVVADPVRIVFGAGQTSATRSGYVTPTYSPQYLVRLLAGQDISMSLRSDGDWANFSVVGVTDGVMYKTAADLQDDFAFRTTRAQDYLVTVVTPRDQNFTFTVYAAPLAQPTPQVRNQGEIKLRAGATSANLTGTTQPLGTDRYHAAAQRGQIMTVSLQSTGSVLRFEVTDLQTGAILEPLNDPSPVWSGTLPETGSFQIDVVSNANVVVDYTLHVAFSALGGESGESQPQRIRFTVGSTSATVGGTITPPVATKYILGASGGQTMSVGIDPWGSVGVSVYGVDGTVLQSPMGSLSSFSGVLPSTQDYIISLTSLTGGNVSFNMNVTIE